MSGSLDIDAIADKLAPALQTLMLAHDAELKDGEGLMARWVTGFCRRKARVLIKLALGLVSHFYGGLTVDDLLSTLVKVRQEMPEAAGLA